jgi:hypothetical protein
MRSIRWMGGGSPSKSRSPAAWVGSAGAESFSLPRDGADSAYFAPIMLSVIFLSPFQMVRIRGLPLNFPDRKYWLA